MRPPRDAGPYQPKHDVRNWLIQSDVDRHDWPIRRRLSVLLWHVGRVLSLNSVAPGLEFLKPKTTLCTASCFPLAPTSWSGEN